MQPGALQKRCAEPQCRSTTMRDACWSSMLEKRCGATPARRRCLTHLGQCEIDEIVLRSPPLLLAVMSFASFHVYRRSCFPHLAGPTAVGWRCDYRSFAPPHRMCVLRGGTWGPLERRAASGPSAASPRFLAFQTAPRLQCLASWGVWQSFPVPLSGSCAVGPPVWTLLCACL